MDNKVHIENEITQQDINSHNHRINLLIKLLQVEYQLELSELKELNNKYKNPIDPAELQQYPCDPKLGNFITKLDELLANTDMPQTIASLINRYSTLQELFLNYFMYRHQTTNKLNRVKSAGMKKARSDEVQAKRKAKLKIEVKERYFSIRNKDIYKVDKELLIKKLLEFEFHYCKRKTQKIEWFQNYTLFEDWYSRQKYLSKHDRYIEIKRMIKENEPHS